MVWGEKMTAMTKYIDTYSDDLSGRANKLGLSEIPHRNNFTIILPKLVRFLAELS
jgi:hypothetical protein